MIGGPRRSSSERVETTRAAIRELMWTAVGLERDAATLRRALETLEGWCVDGQTVAELEDRNLLELAGLTARAALVREESRGAHDRTDHPETRPEWAHSLVWRRESARNLVEALA